MKSFRLPGLSALGILTMLCGIGFASAAPIISGDYYEENAGQSCTGSACGVEFSAVPSKVLLTSISCVFSGLHSQAATVQLGIRDGIGQPLRRHMYLPFSPVATITSSAVLSGKWHTVSTPIDFMVAQGRFPTVIILTEDSNTNADNKCKITGRIQH